MYKTYSQDGIEWLKFNLLSDQKKLSHYVFLREGGSSLGPYRSLNLSYSCGDDPDFVSKNYSKILNLSGYKKVVKGKLCHGKEVSEVDFSTRFPPIVDSLVTKEIGLGLMMTHADCQCTIIYDPIKHVVANVHSGWRGNVQNIYKETVDYLVQKMGSKVENLLVCIGPSLGPESSEFINYHTELPAEFWAFEKKKNHFDLWEISEYQLKEAKILPSHIEIMKIDTFCDARFFSYRRDKPTGRNASIVALL